MSNQLTDKFNFFIPASFEKAGEEGEMRIKGVCSSAVKDSDDEILDPSGFDFQSLLQSGFYNWNHQANKEPGAILGRPTIAKVINNGRDFYTEGFLYKGLPKARDVFDLAHTLEREDPERALGFSIEGQAIERDPINPKRIKRARITGIAITHCPKNPNTLLSIIKGEYSEPFVEEKQVEVVVEVLTKSQVFDLIFDKYTTDIEKSKTIFTFIQTVNEKLFKMANDKITQDTLKKAFELLDASLIKSEDNDNLTTTTTTEEISKNEESTTTTTTTEKVDDEVEKAKKTEEEMEAMAKSLVKSGKSKEECVNDMVEKGFNLEKTQSTVEKVLAEYKSQQDGGDIAKLSKSLETLSNTISKSIDEQSTLLKGLVDELNPRFKALGEILKHNSEGSEMIKSNIDELSKSFEALQERIKTVEEEPFPKRSVTNVRHLERFDKSAAVEGGVDLANTYNLSVVGDRRSLSQRLFAEVEKLRSVGRSDEQLEKAIMDLEISKSVPTSILPKLTAYGIKLVSN